MSALIVAAGQTRFGAHPALGVKELFAHAVADMLESADTLPDTGQIEAAFIGTLSAGQGMQLGNFAPSLMDHAGLPPVSATRVENACASGSYALVQAILAVESGRYECVLAAGVEKMRDVAGERGRYWLGISGDTEYERLAGLTFAGVFALMASRLIHDGEIVREDLARVAVKNHANATLNPAAHLQRELEIQDVLKATPVASPFGAFDCCPTSDGAAAVLVVSEARARDFSDQPSRIAGWGTASDSVALHARGSLTDLPAVGRAAQAAYRMAGATPDDLDLVEAHDCFTVAEILAYRELGLCGPDSAAECLRRGDFDRGGRLPVNASGGLKAKGHPIGATGIGQIVELHRQLRGEARKPERQIQGAHRGLAQNVGGSGASATVTILERSAP